MPDETTTATAAEPEAKTIPLRWAKPTREDMAQFNLLIWMLNDIDGGDFPRDENGEFSDEAPNWFDEDDGEHCTAAIRRLLKVMKGMPGGLNRIGFMVASVFDNDVFDPAKDHLAWHPELQPAMAKLRRQKIIAAATAETSPLIIWRRHDGGRFNDQFSGYRARHYASGTPKHGWVLAYIEGGGDITHREFAPEAGMEPVRVKLSDTYEWRWIQFGKEASHG